MTFRLSLLLIWQIGILVIMPSDDRSTVCDVEKVDDYDYDKGGSEEDVAEEPIDFPEGGTRAWMAVVGRFDFRNRALAEFDEELCQLPFSVLQLWVRFRYRFTSAH